MLKPGKYLSAKKGCIRLSQKQKKQRIMRHRQFKTECICTVMINNKLLTYNELKEVKKNIYSSGTRGEKYVVEIVDKKTGLINDIYLLKYTTEGAIFQKQMYSRWKEEKSEAKKRQLKITEAL